jgi:hypothetical protein
MDPETRRAWLEVVSGDDYDQHMATIGQAQVNASLVCQMLGDHPLAPGARLLFVGCGTGQILDFVDLDEIRRFTITFSDINPEFLTKLEGRLRRDGLESTGSSQHSRSASSRASGSLQSGCAVSHCARLRPKLGLQHASSIGRVGLSQNRSFVGQYANRSSKRFLRNDSPVQICNFGLLRSRPRFATFLK